MERSRTEIAAFQRLRNAFLSNVDEARRMISAEPALLNVRNGIGETVMHWLAVENQIEAVTTLLELGAEVDPVNDFDSTPLLECVTLKNAELVALFIPRGASVSQVSHTGMSPISEAARRNRPAMLHLVLPALHPNIDINSLFDDWDANEALDRGDEVAQLLAARGLRKRDAG